MASLLCIWVCDSPCLQRLHSNAVPTNKYHGNPVCSRGAGEVGEHQITKWHWLFKCHYIKIELLERAGPCQLFSSWLWHLCYFACICLCDKQGVSVFIMPPSPPPTFESLIFFYFLFLLCFLIQASLFYFLRLRNISSVWMFYDIKKKTPISYIR